MPSLHRHSLIFYLYYIIIITMVFCNLHCIHTHQLTDCMAILKIHLEENTTAQTTSPITFPMYWVMYPLLLRRMKFCSIGKMQRCRKYRKRGFVTTIAKQLVMHHKYQNSAQVSYIWQFSWLYLRAMLHKMLITAPVHVGHVNMTNDFPRVAEFNLVFFLYLM